MTKGVTAELTELISLQRFARAVPYRPEGRAARSGNHLSRRRGRGMDFAEVRNYQAGDEIRHMEWRVTARTGKPHIKLYQEERERPVIIVADFNGSMCFGTHLAFKSVIAARLAALIAWTASKEGDWVGGLVFSAASHSEFTPKARKAGVLALLAGLSEYTQQGAVSPLQKVPTDPKALSRALSRLHRVVKPGSVVVVISDFYHLTHECEQLLTRLREHNEILAYLVCDPLELHPPMPQQYAITNGEEELVLDTSNRSVSEAYQRYCQHRLATLDTQFKGLQIQLTQLTAEDDLPRLVYYSFPRRSRG